MAFKLPAMVKKWILPWNSFLLVGPMIGFAIADMVVVGIGVGVISGLIGFGYHFGILK